MKQKDIRVSDAIPEMPQSVDRTVEQTIAKACTERKAKETGAAQSEPSRQGSSAFSDRKKPRRKIFACSAAAVLLVAALALGGVVVKNAIGRRINDPVVPAATPAPQDATVPQSDVSYYFLVNSVPVYPYEGFVWESKPELEADGIGVRLEDEEVRNQIPVTEYSLGMPFVVLTADGWKLDEIRVFDAAYERIKDVAGSRIPWEKGNGYVATELLQTLSPGTYYVSAIVSYRAENYGIGNEIAICLKVGAEVPAS